MKRIICLVLVLIIILCGCTVNLPQEDKNADTPAGYPVKGGQIRIALYNFDTLNPLISRSQSVVDAMGLVFEGLMRRTKDLRVEPCLAEGFFVSENRLEYTFLLRRGIKWHDGSDFTSKQVEQSINIILNNPEGMYHPVFKYVSKCSFPDDYTVKINLKQPVGGFEELMCFPIVKPTGEGSSFVPVGTGRYKFYNYEASKQVRLKANGSYWGGVTPYIDEAVLYILPDKDAAIYAFEAREVNVITTHAADLTKYNPKSGANIIEYNSDLFNYMALNSLNPIFASKNVRKAILAAIDKDVLVQKVMFGHATAVDAPINPDSYLYDISRKPTDKELAEKMLIEDGWQLNSQSGIYEKDMGDKVQGLYFEILVNEDNERRVLLANCIAEMLAESGINAVVKDLDYDSYINMIKAGDFAAYLGEVKVSQNSELDVFADITTVPDGLKDHIDAINAAEDAEQRKKAYSDAIGYFINEAPVVPLYFKKQGVIIDGSIKGEVVPVSDNVFGSVEGWYVEYSQN